ncbi:MULTISPECIES: OmpW/AlkL family protein [Roseovarius]|uniref:OmpW/AlkL family protein n=1 Tax=Roseovarius TaxID=74030 RepID=UPI001C961CC9|nr:OmpW family outer membrane protein [Roseovarius atlanticus]MBY5989216.1 outer membrane beta-barrel protein [Roseovarius atlanticus]MBY6124608.1 outer membrane beta-barrel protein [Roseovarius atlanticus]MBY6149103.1 outer membrane beta-barrel protein [Roseovarius atlanticus]
MKHLTALALAALVAGAAPALAQERGDVSLGIGLAGVIPESGNGVLAGPTPISVDNGYSLSLTGEYFIANNLGVELLAAWPFAHDVDTGGVKIGEVKHLPPTLSLQYHFTNKGNITPFIGAGLNYTTFTESKAVGPLAGNDLDLDDSWGLALHAGLDYRVSDKGALRTDVRWMNIESDVKLNGVDIGKAKINPWVFGVSYVHTF